MNARTPDARPLPQHIHLVGIGGIGLSAIARVLVARGHTVSGSDLRASAITDDLERLGVTVHVGHAANQIAGAELVVASSAIPAANPELAAARQAGIPVLKRQQFLGSLMAGYKTVAVAGTHGKTTTSAMIATMLQRLGQDPTFIVGGVLQDAGTNARAGSGRHFVIEADEYDRMFHGLSPDIAVVTNVEMDHPDCYPTMEAMREAFRIFARRVDPQGALIVCAESPEAYAVAAGLPADGPEVITYGRGEGADYRLKALGTNVVGGVAFGVHHGDEPWAAVSLAVPGAHNALNATAALIVAARCGLDHHEAARALEAFHGVERRFQLKGEAAGVVVVDDYAHHPTEIRATLRAARERYPERAIWAVWQPHTYSRTEALYDAFQAAFDDADHVIVTDIYAARAKERVTVRAADLVAAMDHADARHLPGADDIVPLLVERLCPGDLLITLGAGDGYRIGERVLAELSQKAEG